MGSGRRVVSPASFPVQKASWARDEGTTCIRFVPCVYRLSLGGLGHLSDEHIVPAAGRCCDDVVGEALGSDRLWGWRGSGVGQALGSPISHAEPAGAPVCTPMGAGTHGGVCGAQSISQTCQLCKSKVFLQPQPAGIPPVWAWGEGRGHGRCTPPHFQHVL